MESSLTVIGPGVIVDVMVDVEVCTVSVFVPICETVTARGVEDIVVVDNIVEIVAVKELIYFS
jgi:hypothetical protein